MRYFLCLFVFCFVASSSSWQPGFRKVNAAPLLTKALRVAVAESLQAETKLRGAVNLMAPGSLPNDGKVIADERPAG